MVKKYKKTLKLNLKKGSLTSWIKDKYGTKAFTDRGTIKIEYLKKALRDAPTLTTKRKVQFAINARKWKRKRRCKNMGTTVQFLVCDQNGKDKTGVGAMYDILPTIYL